MYANNLIQIWFKFRSNKVKHLMIGKFFFIFYNYVQLIYFYSVATLYFKNSNNNIISTNSKQKN